MINNSLAVLGMYAQLGVRYLTLTHSVNTDWADSSGDQPKHNGLTDFGKDVVRELNRLGVIVDISHVSDKTFQDAIEVSKAPMIAWRLRFRPSSVRRISSARDAPVLRASIGPTTTPSGTRSPRLVTRAVVPTVRASTLGIAT